MPMREPLAYFQGRLLPQSQAGLTLHDAGFVWGATVTDLCRTFGGRLFRCADHLRRWRAGCAAVGIDVAVPDAEITANAEELVAHNLGLASPGTDLALVLFATPGPIGYYLGEPGGIGEAPATWGMHTFPLPLERYRPLFERGAQLWVPSVPQVPPACVDPRIKQRSRLHWWLAEREVRQTAPGHQALLRSDAGHLTETAAANFLVVVDGTVIAPPEGTVLEGVSLGVTAELCAAAGISFQRQVITLEEAWLADEAWLCGTAFCLAGVARLHGREIPWPGPILQQLEAAWIEHVGMDFAAQILGRTTT